MPQNYILARLLSDNEEWAKEVEKAKPGFFTRLAEKQTPKVLWIGCADSRVPESVVTASEPGDIFVHRNIANQLHLDDDNALSVLDYAVHSLGVSHVIVVGHTNCGGVNAAVKAAGAPSAPPPTSPLERWLAPLVEIARANNDKDKPLDMVDVNVKAQVDNIVKSKVIQSAWEKNKDVQVHGWVYDLETGKLRDLGITEGKGAQ
ncbi:carbonic anhydrase [Fomes fomentarius]|nr:carbonic anhydrase [Fomes fomentarius]